METVLSVMGVWLINTYAWLIVSVGVWLTWLSLGSTPRAMDQRCLLRDTGQPDLQSCLASGARPSLTTGGGGGVGDLHTITLTIFTTYCTLTFRCFLCVVIFSCDGEILVTSVCKLQYN